MFKKKILGVISGLMVVAVAAGFNAYPYNASWATAESSSGDQGAALKEDRADILREAFRILGWDDFKLLIAMDEGFVASHEIPGEPLVVNMSINTKSVAQEYEANEPDCVITQVDFHSHNATEITTFDVWGNVSGHVLEWEMNGRYFIVGKGSTRVASYRGSLDEVYQYAEALYTAAGGSAAGKPPAGEPCDNVVCSPDHCGEDGITLYYDCACDPVDGECYCYTRICAAGCDEQNGVCISEVTPDLCAGVTCEPSCEDNVSFSGGQCDPELGVCTYSTSQDCGLAGCDEATGLCRSLTDLSIKEVKVFQAVEGGDLAANKPTAVLAGFNWPDPSQDALVSVTLSIDGNSIATQSFTAKSQYRTGDLTGATPRNYAEFHIPPAYLSFGKHSIRIDAVLQNDDLIDPDTSNNSYEKNNTFIHVKNLHLIFGAEKGISKEAIWKYINRTRRLLLDIFPVPEITIAPMVYSLNPDGGTINSIFLERHRRFYNSTSGKKADFAVGVISDSSLPKDVYGMNFTGRRRSVIVGDGSANSHAHHAVPHEMGTALFGLFSDEYKGQELGKYLSKGTLIYRGQSKAVERIISDIQYFNFMGRAGSPEIIWVNKDTWNKLIETFGFWTTSQAPGKVLAKPTRPQEYIGPGYLITGSIDANDQVEITSVLPREELLMEAVSEGEFWLEAYDGKGSQIGREALEVEPLADEASFFIAAIPADITSVQELRILHGEQIIWSLKPSKNAPIVNFDPIPSGQPLGGEVQISWQAQDADGDVLIYTLFYSVDNGQTWLPLETDLAQSNYTMNTEWLPGSVECMLQVIASDGWHATSANSAVFQVAQRQPVVEIESPAHGQEFEMGAAVQLSGFAYDDDEGWIDGMRIVWSSSLDGELGQGNELTFASPSEGRHVISAEVTDSSGLTAETQIEIVVGATIAPPDNPPDNPPSTNIIGFYIGMLILAAFLLAGAVILLVVMKRKQNKRMIIVAAILLGITALCLLGSLVLLIAEMSNPTPPIASDWLYQKIFERIS